MVKRILGLWREPLLHFLLLGFALFLYYDLGSDDAGAPPRRIHVERGQVQQLVANFERTWSRTPTAEELDAMVEGHVREEVFYREALAMGLDRDDPMVRRRLRMKLEFILEDLTPQDVSDTALEDFVRQNADDFRRQTQVSFRHVYLDPDRRPDLPADAARLLAALNDGANADELGDPTLAPRNYQRARQDEIERDFGQELAREVVALPPGAWRGPVYSPFGAHLLKIDERIEARLPPLAEIRDEVLRDYLARQRQRQKDLAYERLREGYEVTVEPLGAEAAGILSSAKAGWTR
jgi:parvulin-like peptidyl-prolyl isomerase